MPARAGSNCAGPARPSQWIARCGDPRGDANAGFDLTSLGFPKKLVDQLPYGAFFGRYTFADYISLVTSPRRAASVLAITSPWNRPFSMNTVPVRLPASCPPATSRAT